MTGHPSGCWRVSGAGRWGVGLLFGGFSLVASIDSVANGHSWLDGAVVGAVLMPLWVLGAMRPKLCASRETLVVRNPFWTHRIPAASIADVQPGYFGLVITRRDRGPVHAWAVQQGNAAAVGPHETRAQEVARWVLDVMREGPDAQSSGRSDYD